LGFVSSAAFTLAGVFTVFSLTAGADTSGLVDTVWDKEGSTVDPGIAGMTESNGIS